MKQVKCKSGLWGWQGKLRSVYKNKKEFNTYDEIFSIADRLGYKNAKKCWKDNPMVQGSVNPSDLRRIKE